jgi:allophanate hydrolase subunit 2
VRPHAWRTEGIPVGAVQIPADGTPILLLADRQTTGGYPKPAVIAAVDLPAAGQLQPGDRVAFRLVAREEAVEMLHEREAILTSARPDRHAGGGIDSTISTLQTSNVTELEIQRGAVAFKWTRPSAG